MREIKQRLDYSGFDARHGYDQLDEFCRQNLQRPIPEHSFELLQSGIEQVSLLGPDYCRKLRNMIDLDSVFLRQRAFKVHTLTNILNRELDDRLVAYFESEYLPLWCGFEKSTAGERNGHSFRWHCDEGPSRHLRLSLCLNGTYAHGDTIEFVERGTTDAFKREGYVAGDISEPTLDLARRAAGYGADWQPRRLEMAAGDGALFEPANVLHRGISPAHGSRYMIEVCLVPAPAPWHEMCAYYAVPSTSAGWPLVDETWPAQVLATAEQVA